MTHNIQIGVNIDDDSIIKGVKGAAVSDIEKAMFGHIVTTQWGATTFTREFLNGFFKEYMDEVFERKEIKELIATKAADILAERLMRSNKFKEKIAEKMDEVNQ